MLIGDWSADVCLSDLRLSAHVLLRDAELLGGDERMQRPGADIAELRVVLPHDRPQRLLRNHVRQDHVVVGLAEPEAAPRPAAALAGVGVAASRLQIGEVLPAAVGYAPLGKTACRVRVWPDV